MKIVEISPSDLGYDDKSDELNEVSVRLADFLTLTHQRDGVISVEIVDDRGEEKTTITFDSNGRLKTVMIV